MEKQDYTKEREALLNDPTRKELFKKLFECYANSMPFLFKTKESDFIVSYPPQVEELADRIREEIRLRDNEILERFGKKISNR
jgi:hypothetical protein